MKILITGGMGFIGSHTIVNLLEQGFDVISVDNMSRAWSGMNEGIYKITKVNVQNYNIDLCDFNNLCRIFSEHKDIEGIIHFAAYKDVLESVNNPLLYYYNNIVSTINILNCVEKFLIKNFIYSSSCTVYGNSVVSPVSEDSAFGEPACPYAYTKQIGEKLIHDFALVNKTNFILLRYFNPSGAHTSNHIGEFLHNQGNHLVPVITQVASGIRKELIIHGNDYPTKDGTGLRDFIHVMDIAEAHILALKYLLHKKNIANVEIFNLGTGSGITVLEAIKTFEKVTGIALNYKIGPRRAGDIAAIYASNDKAKKVLKWYPKYNIEDIMSTAWLWQKKLNELI